MAAGGQFGYRTAQVPTVAELQVRYREGLNARDRADFMKQCARPSKETFLSFQDGAMQRRARRRRGVPELADPWGGCAHVPRSLHSK
jgi:hypothetical protein